MKAIVKIFTNPETGKFDKCFAGELKDMIVIGYDPYDYQAFRVTQRARGKRNAIELFKKDNDGMSELRAFTPEEKEEADRYFKEVQKIAMRTHERDRKTSNKKSEAKINIKP